MRTEPRKPCEAVRVLVRQCPVTGGVPTRMTRSAWDAVCAAMREKMGARRRTVGFNVRTGVDPAPNFCSVCGGEVLPSELTIITDGEESDMAKQSETGVCENCGDRGALTTSYGKRVCTTCLKIRSSVQNHVDKIAIAARSLGKGPALLAALVPDGGGLAIQVTADLLQDIAGLVDYQGEDPAELVEAVRRMALREASREDCAECVAANALLEIAEMVDKKGASAGLVVAAVREAASGEIGLSCGDLNRHWVAVMRACGLEDDGGRKDWIWAGAAAVQTIGELERDLQTAVSSYQAQEREVEALRAQLTLAEQELAGIRAGLEASESNEQTLDVAHRRMAVIRTLDRLYNEAEERANLLQDDLARRDAIIANLRAQVAVTDEALADSELWKPEPAPTVPTTTWGDESMLADFARRVLRGEVAISFRGVQ